MSEDNFSDSNTPMNTEHFVRVAVDVNGGNFLDRKDAQVATPNPYHDKNLDKVLHYRRMAEAKLRNSQHPLTTTEKVVQQEIADNANKEILQRVNEARQLGILQDIDQHLDRYFAEYVNYEDRFSAGQPLQRADLERFFDRVGNMTLNAGQGHIPAALQDRLGGIEAVHFRTRINALQRNAQILLNEIDNRTINQAPQPNVNQQPGQIANNDIGRLIDVFRGVPPEQQRSSYADWMLRGEFGQKFTPGQEPKFYQELQSDERRKYDAMLQLSRAVYVKKITSNHPEEFGSDKNIDLQSMTLEQLEILYQMPGMKLLLQNYARLQVNGEIHLSNGEMITLDDCVDEPAVESIRARLREDVGSTLGISELQQKEADIAAWGMSYCGLIAESANSRYFKYRNMTREKIGHLPSVMIAGEFVAVMHPQEEYEKRCAAGRIWGNLGLWGKTQMQRINSSTGFNGDKDIYLFKDASSPNAYWDAKRTGEKQLVMDNKQQKQKNVILVQSPPLLPHTSVKSFFEETKAGGKQLLDYLMDGKEIPWDQVQDNPFGAWTAKIDAAYKLFEYYKDTEKVIEIDKPGAVAKWANGFSDLINRLGLNKSLTEKRLHNMKYTAVLCGVKGVRNVDDRYPQPNFIGGKTFNAHAQALRVALAHRNVKFLSTNMFGIQEKLEPW